MVHLRHISDVHGTALALAVAGALAEQLGHGQLGIAAAGDDVAVAAVGGSEVILGLDRGERACLSSLLTDAQVDITGQHTLGEALSRVFLERADAHHRAVKAQQHFLGAFLLRVFLLSCQCLHAFL